VYSQYMSISPDSSALRAATVPARPIWSFTVAPAASRACRGIGPKRSDVFGASRPERALRVLGRRDVLRDHGNMSAPTVVFVLHRLLARGLPDRVMMTAFGPGFTCAGLLLETP
jgi:hypothetical protein